MSFEPNNMNTINLGNYEEFFILYMDKELSQEQVKMVDEFLVAHPDLKAELEILMNTKLPLEEFSFDKNGLFAENMKLSSVDEELLLYIDNELPADQTEKVQLELAGNKGYQLQHEVLLKTKLDPSEKIAYPNKKELYRRTERVVSIKMWMRVAAAVVVIAIGGILYFQKPSSPSTTDTDAGSTAGTKNINQKNDLKKNDLPDSVTPLPENPKQEKIAVNRLPGKERKQNKNPDQQEVKITIPVENNRIANNDIPQQQKEDQTLERLQVRNVQSEGLDKAIALIEPKVSINNPGVTSSLLARNTNGTPGKPIASNDDRKGSIKGFLRKATRLIEKRTGIDPTNDGELLIGAVAINLK